MLKIWGRKSSSNVQALMWCIGELGLPYERVDAGFIYGVVGTPEFLALNPNNTVPVLQDGTDPPMWETGAILRYLANTYASGDFWPAGRVERGGVDKWAEWAKLNVAQNFTAPVFWRIVRTPQSNRDLPAIRNALEVLGRYLDIAETRLEKTAYLAGDAFSLADIQFGHCLYRYFDIEIERASRPHLRRYYDELATRTAFRTHVMVAYEELRDRL